MNLTLKGRTALVSGGSGTVGYDIVTRFLEDGMKVGTLHSRKEKAWMTTDWLKEYGDQFLSLSVETRDPITSIYEKFGGIDVLVVGQGWPPVNQDISEITDEYWSNVVRSNLTRGFQMMQKTIPYLKQSTAPRIIFLVSSEARSGGLNDGLAYTAAKGGVISMMYSAARRLAKYGITVNAVAMGGIYNKPYPVTGEEPEENLPDYTEMQDQIPLGRLGKPEDVCAAVCYLASEEESFVTGEILNVNGGLFMG